MRRKSHQNLARFLAQVYLSDKSAIHQKAFLIGCTEPDVNPLTYLKGSIRAQWLRGHNYNNAERFLMRLCSRLETRQLHSLWDYYSLGKLMHYTADAFTYAHNSGFPEGIPVHRSYEKQLQTLFLVFLESAPISELCCSLPACQIIARNHRQYLRSALNPPTDICYTFSVCCMVMAHLCTVCNRFSDSPKEALPFS